MPREVEKKIFPEYFNEIKTGEKTFELRLADFDISKGDTLVLRELDSEKNEYTGETLLRKTYTLFEKLI